jgi:uncharacterized protein YjbJ (UPF0337 family)
VASGAANFWKEAGEMNRDILQGRWAQLKGKVREKWGQLTDDEVDQIAGQKDQLVGKVQERYGLAKDEAERQIDEWLGTQPMDAEASRVRGSNF